MTNKLNYRLMGARIAVHDWELYVAKEQELLIRKL